MRLCAFFLGPGKCLPCRTNVTRKKQQAAGTRQLPLLNMDTDRSIHPLVGSLSSKLLLHDEAAWRLLHKLINKKVPKERRRRSNHESLLVFSPFPRLPDMTT